MMIYQQGKRLCALAVLYLLGGSLAVVSSASPLISIAQLQQKIGQDNLVLLETQPAKYYPQAHLPGSVQTDYANWRTTSSEGIKEMLPAPAQLEALIGSLGIDNQSEVVIVPVGRGASDMAAAARIYWSLYVAGLDKLSILDGGLLGYYNLLGDSALVTGQSSPAPKPFELRLRESELINMQEVADHVEKSYSIIDARSPIEFQGRKVGSPGERPGHIPGAINLPYDSLMNVNQDGLASVNELRNFYKAAGVPLEGEQVAYCHSGHRAALVWFVSHELLGNADARLYDGSMIQWAATSDRPMVVK